MTDAGQHEASVVDSGGEAGRTPADATPRRADAGDKSVRDATVTKPDVTSMTDAHWDGAAIHFDAATCVEETATGAPPADCIAPCLWKYMSACRLSNCCGQETVYDMPSSPIPTLDQRCDEHGVLEDTQHPFHEIDKYVYLRGKLCYSVHASFGTAILNVPWQWFDANGKPIATVNGDMASQSQVDCDGTTYDTDMAQPKCASWATPSCVPGICSRAP